MRVFANVARTVGVVSDAESLFGAAEDAIAAADSQYSGNRTFAKLSVIRSWPWKCG